MGNKISIIERGQLEREERGPKQSRRGEHKNDKHEDRGKLTHSNTDKEQLNIFILYLVLKHKYKV